MYHTTVSPAIVRQINELQKEPTKDTKLEKTEKKIIGEGFSELVNKLKGIRVKNPRKNIKITM